MKRLILCSFVALAAFLIQAAQPVPFAFVKGVSGPACTVFAAVETADDFWYLNDTPSWQFFTNSAPRTICEVQLAIGAPGEDHNVHVEIWSDAARAGTKYGDSSDTVHITSYGGSTSNVGWVTFTWSGTKPNPSSNFFIHAFNDSYATNGGLYQNVSVAAGHTNSYASGVSVHRVSSTVAAPAITLFASQTTANDYQYVGSWAGVQWQKVTNAEARNICEVQLLCAGGTAPQNMHVEIWSDSARAGTKYGASSDTISMGPNQAWWAFRWSGTNPNPSGDFYIHFFNETNTETGRWWANTALTTTSSYTGSYAYRVSYQ